VERISPRVKCGRGDQRIRTSGEIKQRSKSKMQNYKSNFKEFFVGGFGTSREVQEVAWAGRVRIDALVRR
jgi:hypothetical protein